MTEGGRLLDVDDSGRITEGVAPAGMMREGLGGEASSMEVPKTPSFTSAAFPRTRESLYDTGLTSQNVGRRGLQAAGSGLAKAGGWVKDKWGRWIKRPTNVDLGSLEFFGK